jgi:hypothetical protein
MLHPSVITSVNNNLTICARSLLRAADADGNSLPSQLVPASASTLQLQHQLSSAGLAGDPAAVATQELAFEAVLPPVGYSSYVVQLTTSSSSSNRGIHAAASVSQRLQTIPAAVVEAAASVAPEPASIKSTAARQTQQQTAVNAPAAAAAAAAQQELRQLSNGRLNITLDTASGRFFAIAAADGSWGLRFSQELMWYKSSTGEEERQASGAYIFRPANDAPVGWSAISMPSVVQRGQWRVCGCLWLFLWKRWLRYSQEVMY